MFYAQIDANNENCQDRAAHGFNEIFVSWKLANIPEEKPLIEKLQLLRAAAKTLALRTILANQISKRGQSLVHPIEESVEIYLFYEIALKKACGLLTFFEEMAYGSMGKSDWIDEKQLIEEVESSYLDHLMNLPQLQSILDKDSDLSQISEELSEKYGDQFLAIDEKMNTMESQEYLEKVNACKDAYERDLAKLRREYVSKLLSSL